MSSTLLEVNIVTRLIRILNIVSVTFVYSFFVCKSAIADDIEVFTAGASATSSSNPNILFIFDTSGSMSRNQSFTELDEDGNEVTISQSRIGILQDVMSEVVASQTGVNMGLSRFSVPGGPILFPVTDPDEPADPIVLRSLASANDDAVQSGNSVTLDSDYLDPVISGPNGIVGLRFKNVDIPQGAIINNATILFAVDQPSLETGADYEIYAEVVPSASAFTTTVNNLSSRISGLALPWTAEPWAATLTTDYEVEPPTVFETPDLSAVVQQVVNLKGATIEDPAGWCGGNDLVILFKKVGISGRPIIAHDKSADFSPKLRVDFNANIPVSEFGCYANKISRQVADKDHDSESETGGSNSSDLDFYKDSYYRENNASIAISFEDVGVPQGAMINSAKLNFVSRSTSNGAAATTIYAVNSATPPLDTSVHSLPGSAFTAGVPWAIESWDYGVPYQSADISAIVQSVVALPSWDETGDFSFKLAGSSGTRTAYSFNGSRSRSPTLEITYIGAYTPSAATKRQAMIATVEDFKATGNTPISDTYAEAALYFKGEEVTYGLVRGTPAKRDNRISHIDSVISGSIVTPSGCSLSNPSATDCKGEKYSGTPLYNSPIVDACQANHIILLTDGAPTSHDNRTNTLFENWTSELTGSSGSCATNDSGADCTIKMAGLFNNNDLNPSTPALESLTTHTIGFYSDQPFLQSVADAGGGSYVTAFSKQELFDAINTIVDSILDVNTTFVSAGVTVNQYNRVTHSDELYFSLFTPSSETVWPGNLKRYRLSNGQIVDFNENSAVNLGGEFDEAALSYWSPEVDGNEVEKGGAASRLTNTREVYSNLGGGSDLSVSANRVIDNNVVIVNSMIGAVDADDRTKILNWTTGQNVNDPNNPTSARQKMGDPLHSQPSLLIYEVSEGVFRTSVYVGTNDGFLHSFDTELGEENWSFIPKELMPRLSELQKNTLGAHTYGLDGQITLYIHNDTGRQGVVDGSEEKAIMYVGMRRGGSSYYAIDVTDPDTPKLLFTIDPSVTGFDDLGLTWSKPVIKKMKIPDHETVMIFGGGYSTDQDLAGTPSVTDSSGKNIYIVDAFTGELLWDAVSDAVDISSGTSAGSLSTMNAIPNEVTAFDLTGDEYIDHFYVSDTKAQVFRFDINSVSGVIKGGRVAHLQTMPNAANNRRFYNKPDVSLIRTETDNFVAISIGSGYRAHPLDETVVDHFYMIKDKGILNNTFDMDADMSDLVNVTDMIGDTDANGVSDAAELINNESSPKNGWYIDFARSGEKVISNSVTFSNAVIFTTYTPPNTSGGACNAVAGTSRIYGMKVTDGNPYIDSNYDGQLTELDRSATLTTAGIAPEPQILLEGSGEGVTPRLCVGNQCGLDEFLPAIPKGVMGIRWHRNEN